MEEEKLKQEQLELKRKKEEKKTDKPLVKIFFGSQTGTAEGYSKQIAEQCKQHGFEGKVFDLENFEEESFMDASNSLKELYVFLVATYGEGKGFF